MSQLSVAQENLAKGLSIVSRAVAARATLPCLGNILLATDEGGQLRLAATNLELGIVCWIGAKVEKPMASTIPAKTLVDLVNTLPQDRVHLSLTDATQTVALACGRIKANLKGIAAQEFPVIPRADLAAAVEFPAGSLSQMLDQVTYAAATDEARPVLTAVSVTINQDVVKMAASNGFELALRAARLAKPVAQPVSLLIPARALAELRRLLGAEEPVLMCVPEGRGQVIFHHGSIELISQVMEGAFPEYSNIIPKTHSMRAVMNTAEFRKACKSADIFAREAAHTARFKVEPGCVTVLATAAETGGNTAEVAAAVEGETIEIVLNVKYVLDALGAVATEQVALETTTPTSPGVIKPVGREDMLAVVMPMQLHGVADKAAPAVSAAALVPTAAA